MNRTIAFSMLTFGLLAGSDAAFAERVRMGGAKANNAGGTTAGSAAAGSNAKGSFARGGAVATDAAGNAVGGSAGAVQTTNGGQAARAPGASQDGRRYGRRT